jgi:hypothetical protein
VKYLIMMNHSLDETDTQVRSCGCGKLLWRHWPPATAESPSERRRKPMKSPIVRSSDNLLTVLEVHG